MYKVLALDLDGTVLTDNQTILPELKQAIRSIQNQCHVMIVTGRHHTAAKPYYMELELTTPIICCNGTYMYDYQSDQVLTHNAIEKQDALRFIELATKFDMKLVMYITQAMLYSQHNPVIYIEELKQWASQYPPELRPQIHSVDSFSEQAQTADNIWKFVVEGLPGDVERLSDHPWVGETFNGERSWSNRIDFAARGNTKGGRLAEYVTDLGYDAGQVFAVGDNHNDISMIQYAGLGVAMGNADKTVKSHASVICETDNNHAGLARLIRQKIQG
ncbi:Cof-type HAD-IIB family hydrolase [Vibrio sp. PP-XX7]